jgi:hypothetical protein
MTSFRRAFFLALDSSFSAPCNCRKQRGYPSVRRRPWRSSTAVIEMTTALEHCVLVADADPDAGAMYGQLLDSSTEDCARDRWQRVVGHRAVDAALPGDYGNGAAIRRRLPAVRAVTTGARDAPRPNSRRHCGCTRRIAQPCEVGRTGQPAKNGPHPCPRSGSQGSIRPVQKRTARGNIRGVPCRMPTPKTVQKLVASIKPDYAQHLQRQTNLVYQNLLAERGRRRGVIEPARGRHLIGRRSAADAE